MTKGILSRCLKDIKDKEICWNWQTAPTRSKPPITRKTQSVSFFLFPNKVLIATLHTQHFHGYKQQFRACVRKTIRKTRKILELPKMTHSFNLVASKKERKNLCQPPYDLKNHKVLFFYSFSFLLLPDQFKLVGIGWIEVR